MSSDTRARLIHAAGQLFAAHGYRGAPVRDICNLARANPGAVSYHFGGKRQLYRTVLRQTAGRLVAAGAAERTDEPVQERHLPVVVGRIFGRLMDDPVAARLLLRDLADGGTVAVEALEPGVRAALDALSRSAGHLDALRASAEVRLLLLELAAPLFLIAAGWPLVARPLELGDGDRQAVLTELLRRLLVARIPALRADS